MVSDVTPEQWSDLPGQTARNIQALNASPEIAKMRNRRAQSEKHDLGVARREQARLEEKLALLESRIEHNKKELAKEKGENDSLKSANAELASTNHALKEHNIEAALKYNDLEREFLAVQGRNVQLERENEVLKRERDELRSKLQDVNALAETMAREADCHRREAEMRRREADSYRREADSLRGKCDSLETQLQLTRALERASSRPPPSMAVPRASAGRRMRAPSCSASSTRSAHAAAAVVH